MKLVIAEKPSVAQSLARIIGAAKRQDGYLEGNGYLVSWCVGHLVELSAPERYDERFAKWRLEDLPILPERFLYEVSAGTSKQYQILKGLMERPDVKNFDGVINNQPQLDLAEILRQSARESVASEERRSVIEALKERQAQAAKAAEKAEAETRKHRPRLLRDEEVPVRV